MLKTNCWSEMTLCVLMLLLVSDPANAQDAIELHCEEVPEVTAPPPPLTVLSDSTSDSTVHSITTAADTAVAAHPEHVDAAVDARPEHVPVETGVFDSSAEPGFAMAPPVTLPISHSDATMGFRSVGVFVLIHDGASNLMGSESGCDGIHIGPATVLTANHCFSATTNPDRYGFFSQSVGFMRLKSIHGFCDQAVQPCSNTDNDLALVVLQEAADWIPNARLASEPPAVGERVTLVGFGVENPVLKNGGLKRKGHSVTSECPQGSSDLICVAGGDDPLSQSLPCPSDSGGPLYRALVDEYVIAGITRSGEHCNTGGFGEYTDLTKDKYQRWIAGFLNDSASAANATAAPRTPVLQCQHQFPHPLATVPAQITIPPELVATGFDIVVNYERSLSSGPTSNQFDVTLQGAQDADCRNTIQGFGFCHAPSSIEDNPVTARIEASSGQGSVQITLLKHE